MGKLNVVTIGLTVKEKKEIRNSLYLYIINKIYKNKICLEIMKNKGKLIKMINLNRYIF